MRSHLLSRSVLCVAVVACHDVVTPPSQPPCPSIACAPVARGRLSHSDQLRADSIIEDALRAPDTSGELRAAIATISQFDKARLFPDSVRFHRIVDRVAVTRGVARGGVVQDALGCFYPSRTPHLAWARIANRGLKFQPADNSQHVIYPVPTASLLAICARDTA